jgi:uncharacterized ferritin-like protein (DUF455 family)
MTAQPSRLARTIDLLEQLCGAEKAAALDCAQAAIETPESEAKLFFGSAFFDHAEAARMLAARLASLAEPEASAGKSGFAAAPSTKGKLLQYNGETLGSIAALASKLRDNILPVSDAPTERLLDSHALGLARLRAGAKQLMAAGSDLPTVPGQRSASGYTAPHHPARAPIFKIEGPFVDLSNPDLPTRELAIELMHANFTDLELTTIEICCSSVLENQAMPWEFVTDMARQSWDECRHAESFQRRIETLGGCMGQRPTRFLHWDITRGQALSVTLCSHQMIGEWTGIDGALWFASLFRARGDVETADVFDFVARDECTHSGFGSKWLRYLAPEEARRAQLMEEARMLRARFGKPAEGPLAFPFHRWACEIANYDLAEIDRLQARFDKMGSLAQGGSLGATPRTAF